MATTTPSTPRVTPPTPTTGVKAPAQRSDNIPLYNLGEKLHQGDQAQPRGSISRQQLQNAAGGAIGARALNESVKKTEKTYQDASRAGAITRQSASYVLSVAATIPGLPSRVLTETNRLQQRMQSSQQNALRRQQNLKKLIRTVRRSFVLVILVALMLALTADLLSLADLGWLLDIPIAITTFLLVRRTRKIESGAAAITKAQQAANYQAAILKQRLAPILAASQKNGTLRDMLTQRVQAIVLSGEKFLNSYFEWILETGFVDIAEIIPAIDWIPFYLGQFLKTVTMQYIAYQDARKLIPPLQESFALIERLEALEIEHLTRRLANIVGAYQQQYLREVQRHREVAQAEQAAAYAPQSFPAYAT